METIIGKRFKAVINGKNCLNGKLYGCTLSGQIQSGDGTEDIYEAVAQIAESLRSENREMEYPQSIRITIE